MIKASVIFMKMLEHVTHAPDDFSDIMEFRNQMITGSCMTDIIIEARAVMIGLGFDLFEIKNVYGDESDPDEIEEV